jgi:3-methyladenine DNA glycosylase AlkC
MSEIPSDVLRGLNEGRLETVTLVEWLAMDGRVLLRHALEDIGFRGDAAALLTEVEALRSEGVARRVRGTAAAIHAAFARRRDGRRLFEALAAHPSDMARTWAAYAAAMEPHPRLRDLLAALRRFAADRSMAVRESAWDALRPHLVRDLDAAFRALRSWVRDGDPSVRRCAVEATRPRGVWCAHIESLKRDPEPGLVLLEHVRADPSDYVRRSAANWINDASKSRPDWARAVCKRWLAESPEAETRWIVNHALRTLRKRSGGGRKS